MKEIRWFEEIRLTDTDSVGGKGANLGELTAGGLPVPPGFVITGEAYLDAIGRAGIRDRLVAILAEARTASQDDLDRLAAEARELVHGVPIPKDLAADIVKAYKRLGKDVRVAVRSSGIGEDAEGTSFAGMNETFTNVAGEEDVLARVVDCWASLWKARSIFYRGDKDLTEEPAIAVVIQEMIPSVRSGVMFTIDPSTGETDHIVIEAAFGQGEVVVSGQVEPDTYVVSKDGPRLLHARVGTQFFEIVRGPDGEDQRVELDAAEGGRRVLSRPGGHRGGAHRPGHRGALRLAAGHGVGHGRRPDLPGAVAARDRGGRRCRSGRDGRIGHLARAGPGGLGGPGLRGRARAADTRPGRAPAGR